MASFHLLRHNGPLTAMSRLATDRLRRPPGLVTWRLLGTGRGADTGPSADLRRTAVFAVWEDDAAFDRFVATPRQRLVERYDVRLRLVGGHGRWGRADVLGDLQPGPDDGPIAVLTRASVRVRAWRPFRAAGRVVSAELAAADGLLAAVGVGELPVGRLGTFSLWRSAADVRAFALAPRHAETVRRTRVDGWYREELFARFAPDRSSGTWDGRDPLA